MASSSPAALRGPPKPCPSPSLPPSLPARGTLIRGWLWGWGLWSALGPGGPQQKGQSCLPLERCVKCSPVSAVGIAPVHLPRESCPAFPRRICHAAGQPIPFLLDLGRSFPGHTSSFGCGPPQLCWAGGWIHGSVGGPGDVSLGLHTLVTLSLPHAPRDCPSPPRAKEYLDSGGHASFPRRPCSGLLVGFAF